MTEDFRITHAFVEDIAAFFHLLLQQVSEISESEFVKADECLVLPKVRITSYHDKSKSKVEWKFGRTIRYRHLTMTQIKNLANRPFSIMRKIAKSFKELEL